MEEVFYQNQLLEDRRQSAKYGQKKQISKILEISEISKEIEIHKVTTLLRFILALSILADILGLIPIAGSIFGFIFSIIFFVLYYLNGLGRGSIKRTIRGVLRKRISKWALRIFFLSAESVPILGILPMFTIMALVEIALSQKKVKKLVNKMGEITNKIK